MLETGAETRIPARQRLEAELGEALVALLLESLGRTDTDCVAVA